MVVGPNHYDKYAKNKATWKEQTCGGRVDGKDYKKWEQACFETQLWKEGQWQAMVENAKCIPFNNPKGPGHFEYDLS